MNPHLNEMERFLAEASLEVFRGLRTLQFTEAERYESCGVHLQLASNWILRTSQGS